jgi:NADP-dependent 3-hydroxy acid dehydrogenase YdfG
MLARTQRRRALGGEAQQSAPAVGAWSPEVRYGRIECALEERITVTEPLTGTVALVTGASSGIGEATARALAARGASVVAVARRKDRLDTLVDEIASAGGSALAIVADITDEERASAVVAETVAQFGRLDIVVNNAGVMLLGPIVDAPTEEWQRMLDINVRGLLAMSHAALPHLLAAAEQEPRHVADIVNISSVAGRTVRSGSGVYNLTKWGVGVFSESLRQEVTSRYVRVSIVEPGLTATELGTHLRPEIAEQMSGRFAGVTALKAEDIADAIVFIVTRDRDVAINELLVRPTGQAA